MLGDQGEWIARRALQERQDVFIADVPERDRDVAQEAATFDAGQGRLAKSTVELGVIEDQQCG